MQQTLHLDFDPEKSQYVLTQMQKKLQNSINNTINNGYIFPFPKYELI
jgi:hypothetical protein